MKYILLTFFAWTLGNYALGQVIAVDTPHCHYINLHAEVTGGIIPTSSGITADDNWSSVVPIGFTFNFYGLPNTQCIIGSNGCLGFDLANALAYNTWPIGNTLLASTGAAPDVVNCICGPWCDVYIPAGGTIDYSMQGTAPFRNFAVTWCGTAMYSCTTEWLTTQIVIYETTGICEVHIGHRTICLTGWNGQHAICGVKDPTGTIATTAPGRDYPTVWAATTEAWRFTPSAGTYTVASIPYAPIPYAASAVYWYDSATHAYLGTGPTITVVPTVPTTYAAAVLGCQDTTFTYVTVTAADISFMNSCFAGYSNSPCEGDSLKFWLTGDSTGYSFLWQGPAASGVSSTLDSFSVFPCTFADTGMYYIYKTAGGLRDTDSVHVTIYPKPVVNATSNAPLCVGMIDTLRLNVIPIAVGETFAWSGPAGFTSTLDSPTVNGFGFPNVGTYTVIGTTIYGCKDTGSVNAINVPPPAPPPFVGLPAYCYGSTFIPFTAVGTDVLYYSTPSSVGSATAPSVSTTTPGTYTFYATQQLGSCISPMDSFTVVVYPQIQPEFLPYYHHGCKADTVFFTNLSANSDSFTWNFGDASGLSDPSPALVPHVHVYTLQGSYNVILTGYNPVCDSAFTYTVDTRHTIVSSFWPTPDTICLGKPDTFLNNSYTTYQGSAPVYDRSSFDPTVNRWNWDFGNGVTDTSDTIRYTYDAPGQFRITLIAKDTIGCYDTSHQFINVMQLSLHSFTDTTLCLGLPLPMANGWSENPVLGIAPHFSWTQSSPNLNDTTIDTPLLTGFGLFVDTLTITLPGVPGSNGSYGCAISDTIKVHSVSGNPITGLTASSVISVGESIQLNASNEVRYYWTPDNGTLNNPNINDPIATPEGTTTYTVYGLDIYGCLDSASVTITVDTSVNNGIPSAFTPNNDGLNDIFRIPPPPLGNKFDKLVEFRVFNRWGELMFNTNNKSDGWDGKYHGVPQDMGTYFYEIIVSTPGGENITYKGQVTLIR